MRYLVVLLVVLIFLVGCGTSFELKDGDIIFQTSDSAQSKHIELATGSIYTHVGIVYFFEDQPMVYEAVGPVVLTPFEEFVSRGKNRHYVIKRLRDERALNPQVFTAMQEAGEPFAGKPYDFQFLWGDDELYCSELVWKIYERGASIRLSEPRPMRDYSLEKVADEIRRRYGETPPLDEPMVSPGDLFDSPHLFTAYQEGE